jgi:hypothetical protein
VLPRFVELRVAHADADERGIDRIAFGIAELRDRAARRLRQQEPVAMSAFPQQPSLGEAAGAEMRHASTI